ncbi:DUF1631 family protein [Ramlibacter humi]|uniref:DUF1631 family protein n=1 Tax=Ramlibacter humi TaxID=2530451 RepID=A0A4Z0CBH1_9BURK|nr:DUF1631 family protein [Ramlibacter humi]TFZ07768.1 DUF1631 family protein [Ramlibacter humi]
MNEQPTDERALPAYRQCVRDAALQGRAVIQRAVAQVEATLDARLQRARDVEDRNLVHESINLLHRHGAALAEAYSGALLAEFGRAVASVAAAPASASAGTLKFAELELVDDNRMQESVEVLRTQQAVAAAVEHELPHLNALVCAAQGLRTVQAERNPLRPETYVRTLRHVVGEFAVPEPVRLRWLQFLGEALGPEVVRSYRSLIETLRAQGVSEAGFQIAATAPERARAGAPAGDRPLTSLTVHALRRLLAGEPEAAAPAASGAAPAEAAPATTFGETVPAAMEMLKELRDVDAAIQRVRRREREQPGSGDAMAQLRRALQAEARRPGQSIGLEVVRLMIETLVADPRILPPVQQALRALEPALLQLALADPRFFSNRRHPARRLLDEVVSRSLAWHSAGEPGFRDFLGPLVEAVEALATTHVTGAEPYEFALQTLQETWDRKLSRERRRREKAMQALVRAEQRNLLAARLAADFEAGPHLALAPPIVAEFIAGPWCQVIAQAQIDGAEEAPQYAGLVPELLWTLLPHATPTAAKRLAQRLPPLLATLEQGLKSTGYTGVQVRRFMQRLSDLHHATMQSAVAARPRPEDRPAAKEELQQLLGPMLESGGWLAPEEAKQSGFMDSLPATHHPLFQPTEPGPAKTVPAALPDLPLQLRPGSWVELLLEDGWSRWQLAWSSPGETLLMFTNAQGDTHSMTPKLAAALSQAGALRLVSEGEAVDGALDAVADAALMNSFEFRF